ncbi:MAG: HlyD family type I secretion periplasmic adaptor subunit [Burkholderiaceae bacterium]
MNSDALDMTPVTGNRAGAGRFVQAGWWLMAAGFGTFVAWSALAPLDQGVPLTGNLIIAGHQKTVQHQTGGTVEAILVREGETVHAGQVLVRMNSIQARANADITRLQLQAAQAALARLRTERTGHPGPSQPGRESRLAPDAIASDVQIQLQQARRMSLQSELEGLDENIEGLLAVSQGLELTRQSRERQLGLINEQLTSVRDLTRDGFYPRTRLLETEREQAQIAANLAEDNANLERNRRQIAELHKRKQQRQQEFQKEVGTQLADVQKEVRTLETRLQSLEHEVANGEIRSPADGIVTQLSVFTEGGVIAGGQRLMDIVPTAEPLIIEGQIPVNAIDSVHPSLPVEVSLPAYNQNTTPRIHGTVTRVSPDTMVDETTGHAYYRMEAAATPEGAAMLQRLQARPGMPVEIFVRTGERTLINYLLRPLRDKYRGALTEE